MTTLAKRAMAWREGILARMELAGRPPQRLARGEPRSFEGTINGFRCRVASAGTASILLGKRWVEATANFGGFQRALEGTYLLTDTLKRSPGLLAEMASASPITRRPAMAKKTRRSKSKAKAPTKPAPKTQKVKPSAARKSLMTFAREILARSKKPMRCDDIVETAIKGGWKTGGKTPAATLYSSFLRDIGKGKAATIAKAGRGLFKLRAA